MLEFILYLAGLALGTYLLYTLETWWEFDKNPERNDLDPLLDRFLPGWEVAKRHRILVRAPAHFTYAAARALDFEESPVLRVILRLRQLVMRSKKVPYNGPRTVVEQGLGIGWGVLSDYPGRTIVLGAVTQPWQRNPVFRALPAAEFSRFDEPGHAKIIWSIVVEPDGPYKSAFSTETRVNITDPVSRRRFRWYWALVSPWILLIRWALLRQVRKEAESWVAAGVPQRMRVQMIRVTAAAAAGPAHLDSRLIP